jgi:hypothetical protein
MRPVTRTPEVNEMKLYRIREVRASNRGLDFTVRAAV